MKATLPVGGHAPIAGWVEGQRNSSLIDAHRMQAAPFTNLNPVIVESIPEPVSYPG